MIPKEVQEDIAKKMMSDRVLDPPDKAIIEEAAFRAWQKCEGAEKLKGRGIEGFCFNRNHDLELSNNRGWLHCKHCDFSIRKEDYGFIKKEGFQKAIDAVGTATLNFMTKYNLTMLEEGEELLRDFIKDELKKELEASQP